MTDKKKRGRPKGKRSDERIWLAREARKHAEGAIGALVKNLKDENGSIRNTAAREILDRGYGRAPQEIILEDGIEDTEDKPRGLSELLGMAQQALGERTEDDNETSSED